MAKKRRNKITPTRIRGTYNLTQAGAEADEIRSLILKRRLQVLIHSCIYYELNSSIVDDHTWSSWAKELVELQEKYPQIARRVDYHKDFKGFDGSTGFNLPTRNPEVMSKANYLLKIHKERNAYVSTTGHQDSGTVHSPDVIRILFPH